MKQRRLLARFRISATLVGQLKPVAPHAGQTQVVLRGWSASPRWHDMINLHLHHDRLGRLAVLAPAICTADYPLPQRGGDIGHLGPEPQLLSHIMSALLEDEHSPRTQQGQAIRVVNQRCQLDLLGLSERALCAVCGQLAQAATLGPGHPPVDQRPQLSIREGLHRPRQVVPIARRGPEEQIQALDQHRLNGPPTALCRGANAGVEIGGRSRWMRDVMVIAWLRR